MQGVDVLGQQVLKLIREEVMEMRVSCAFRSAHRCRVSTFLGQQVLKLIREEVMEMRVSCAFRSAHRCRVSTFLDSRS